MEFIESETLQDRIAHRPLPNLQEFGSIMTQMLAGLDAIHAAGIVHRDVKPANALFWPRLRRTCQRHCIKFPKPRWSLTQTSAFQTPVLLPMGSMLPYATLTNK